MGRVALLGVGAYAPAKVVTNEDWSRHVNTTDAWITTRTGIKRRHMASDDESTSDLAVAAARSALSDAQLTAAEIDEIIVATDTPDVYIPDTASIVQHRLQAREIPAYDLARGGCAGFLQGVDIACSRTRSGGKVLVIVGGRQETRKSDQGWSAGVGGAGPASRSQETFLFGDEGPQPRGEVVDVVAVG